MKNPAWPALLLLALSIGCAGSRPRNTAAPAHGPGWVQRRLKDGKTHLCVAAVPPSRRDLMALVFSGETEAQERGVSPARGLRSRDGS